MVEKVRLYGCAPFCTDADFQKGETMGNETKTSKAQQKAVNKYVKNNYDRINVTFPKGRKADLQAAAALHGESVNAYIIRAVNDALERDNAALNG